jgi:hypothetical protein
MSIRLAKGKKEQLSATMFGERTIQSTPKVEKEQVMMATNGRNAGRSKKWISLHFFTLWYYCSLSPWSGVQISPSALQTTALVVFFFKDTPYNQNNADPN